MPVSTSPLQQLRWALLLLTALWLPSVLRAATPPPAQLLPDDVLFVLSFPSWPQASAQFGGSPLGQLWSDPAVQPFKNKLMTKLQEELAGPVQRELGIRFEDYLGLVQGQATLAITRNEWDGTSENTPAFLAILDGGDKGDALRARFLELRQKWLDAGRTVRPERIRNIEFSTISLDSKELAGALERIFPDDAEADEEAEDGGTGIPAEIRIGMADSVLIAGSSSRDIERVLVRLAGGMTPALVDHAGFQRSYNESLRNAHLFAWFDFKPVYAVILREAQTALQMGGEAVPFAPQPEKILGALGLGGLETVSLSVRGAVEGSFADVRLGMPSGQRQGLLQLFVPEPKEAGPPAFVPDDVIKFSRWRLDAQKLWGSLEQMLAAISPELAGFAQMMLATLGKDFDPNFDFKTDFIGNLGDDFISYQKRPREATLEEIASPPSLILAGSSNPDQLANAFRSVRAILPGAGAGDPPQSREFLGRTIHSFALPVLQMGQDAPGALHFASAGGYMAVSTDPAILEEFIRSHESPSKPLRQRGGLAEAAERIGGMQTGFFGFEDQRESMRTAVEALRKDPAGWQNLLALALGGSSGDEEGEGKAREWLDFSLLPPFEQIARYFHYVVYAARTTPDGFGWRFFAPVAPDFDR